MSAAVAENTTHVENGVTSIATTTFVGKYRFKLIEFRYSNGVTYFKAYYAQMRGNDTYGQTYDCNYAAYDAIHFTDWQTKASELRTPAKGQSLNELVTEVFAQGTYKGADRVFTTRELAQSAIDRVIAKKKLNA